MRQIAEAGKGALPILIPISHDNAGLGGMVDHELHVAVTARELEGRRQFARPNQEVVHEAGLSDGGYAAFHVAPDHPARVGFVVHLVTDPALAIAAPF